MKWIVFIVLWSSCSSLAQSQVLKYNPSNPAHTRTNSIIEIDIKKDFRAVGNGTADDQPAFDAASAFINARGGFCRLIIPAGTYRVGKQVSKTGGRYMNGLNVLDIGALGSGYKSNIEIIGKGNAILKYKDNMKYGYFSPIGKVLDIQANKSVHISNEAATLGRCISIFNTGNLKISNLILDGNFYPGKMQIGGRHLADAQGIQQEHYGIYIDYSENVEISNVTARRFGLDGFLIFNASSARKNITLNNCLADYNGRQGMSILFADRVFVNNCKFTNTGMGELQYSGLQAGIDLEPERADAIIENVYFKNCIFSDSRNASVVVAAGSGKVRNIFFEDCTIANINEKGNSVALDIGRHKALKFSNCNIYGYVLIASNGAGSAQDGYTFKNCYFSDCYFSAGGQKKTMLMSSSVLIYPPGGSQTWDHVVMNNCIFDVYSKRPWYFLKSAANSPATISNSTIYINGSDKVIGSGSSAVLQDDNINLINNKFYLHDNQSCVHNGQTVVPANNKNLSWNSNTFTRWSAGLPPRVCNSTRKYSSR